MTAHATPRKRRAHATPRKRRTHAGLALGATLLASLGLVGPAQAAQAETAQPELGARSAKTLTIDGLQFKDLDGNGSLTPYEDWRLTAQQRADDLVGRLDLAQRAGLLVHASLTGTGTYDRAAFTTLLHDRHVSTYISRLGVDAKTLASEGNSLQEAAEAEPFGIPLKISTDPRNGFTVTEGQTVSNGDFTPFPDAIGMGAINDPALTKQMGALIAQEYRATGITEALSPQADISTEPRWSRQNGTFGSVGADAKPQVKAYIQGMQGSDTGLSPEGVTTVVKHWVGYGAQANGYDSHYYYGRYAVFPGNNFAEHITPYEGAFEAGASGVMPTYSILKDLKLGGSVIEQVGANHNEYLLQTMLRGQYKFNGVVTSDWGITNDCPQECMDNQPPNRFVGAWGAGMPWGVEDLTLTQRYASAINAGVDIIGGADQPQHIVDAVNEGLLSETRVSEAAQRVLVQKFELGLFENPYVDVDNAVATLTSAEHRALGLDAQQRSLTLLTNSDNTLPLAKPQGQKVYLYGIDPAALRGTGLVAVDQPEGADLALVRLSDPKGGNDLTDLDFKGTEADYSALKAAHDAGAVTIALPQLTRPLILTNVAENSDAVLANYGASDEAILNVVLGKAKPEGTLPFELPSSMPAVAAQLSDVPNDSAAPQFAYRFGLSYSDSPAAPATPAVPATPAAPATPATPAEPATPAATAATATPAVTVTAEDSGTGSVTVTATSPAPQTAQQPAQAEAGNGTTEASAPAALAATGSDPGPIAAIASLTLLLGAGLAWAGRRRGTRA